jgi:hypothetical protein
MIALVAAGETWGVIAVDGVPAIRCALCGRTSEHPQDVANRYCARCHLFLDMVDEARELVRLGGTHDCGEWRTWRNACALCGRVLKVQTP